MIIADKKKRYYSTMSLWIIIAVIWFVQSYRFFNKGDLIGGFLYIITGIVWIFFGNIITKRNLETKKDIKKNIKRKKK